MDIKEYEKLLMEKTEENDLIVAGDLRNFQNRTLLFGYTCDRKTWHVYFMDGKIHVMEYKNDYRNKKPIDATEIQVTNNKDYIPDKRVYPETCDYEFCKLLKQKGVHIPFAAYHERETGAYYGYTLKDV